jgi:phage FluMu protein Com
MDYIEIKLPKCKVMLTASEINYLLLKDTELFAEAIKRTKYINRHKTLKSREQAKWEREEQGFS